MTYQEQLDKSRIPQHVAIIMDGNGRWAEQRGKQRTEGHIRGVEVVRKIMENAVELGIKYLTLYTFSTENWNRPEQEVTALMGLLFKNIEEDVFIRNQVRFRVPGGQLAISGGRSAYLINAGGALLPSAGEGLLLSSCEV